MRQIVLAQSVHCVGLEHGPMPDNGGATQCGCDGAQIAGGPHLFGIDIGQWEITTAHDHRNLEGIDAIILGFTAVDGLHIKRVPQEKLDAVFFTQIGDPVPAVHAFDAHDEIIAKDSPAT